MRKPVKIALNFSRYISKKDLMIIKNKTEEDKDKDKDKDKILTLDKDFQDPNFNKIWRYDEKTKKIIGKKIPKPHHKIRDFEW